MITARKIIQSYAETQTAFIERKSGATWSEVEEALEHEFGIGLDDKLVEQEDSD
jgi:hypothetical protein